MRFASLSDWPGIKGSMGIGEGRPASMRTKNKSTNVSRLTFLSHPTRHVQGAIALWPRCL